MKKYNTEAERKEARRQSKARSRAKIKAAKIAAAGITVQGTQASTTAVLSTAAPAVNITHVGIVTDHSVSMQGIRHQAKADLGRLLYPFRDSDSPATPFYITHAKCGVSKYGSFQSKYSGYNSISESSVAAKHTRADLEDYVTPCGCTPLYDAVMLLIDELEKLPAVSNAAFLVQVITDGVENASITSSSVLARRIKTLQDTDRWTFTFRVPKGQSYTIVDRLNLQPGNVLEWETTADGMNKSSVVNAAATQSYIASRGAGQTSTKSFYANLSNVTSSQVEKACADISADISIWPVATAEDGMQVRDFVEKRLKGKTMVRGTAFYQLTKTEKNVQSYKKIIIRDKSTNAVYGGESARKLLKLPTNANVRLSPGDHGGFDIFIQSTSVNRKILKGTQVVYWEKA